MNGIYIPGMEMPKNCFSCRYICGLRDTQKFTKNCRPDCPLVPVPPHGRLGDLDELARKIEHDRYNHTHTDGLAARHHIAEYGHFLNAIAAAPTIIDAEEGEK